ncbi:hypothetical protein FRUB_02271 [Fimbriiglobus ruber]|uniref:Uncharacterized protein n=1 Tax=Fimbriiglobus ruber TaxID=1908690 RepID=A0A225E4C4_9BACT|nr:hypothetical protein FRUB_02271 [Fimbriiglobus ruber]
MKERLGATGSSEIEERLKAFIARHAGGSASPWVLRGTRAVAVLEAIGSSDARKVLARLAGYRPGDLLCVDAASALARLEKRSNAK